MRERERSSQQSYTSFEANVPAMHIPAEERVARRRKVTLFTNIAFFLAAFGTVGFFVAARLFPTPARNALVQQSFQLQCLSPEQSAEVLRPYLANTSKIWIRPGGVAVVNVESTQEGIATARLVLDRYDNAEKTKCAVQTTVPQLP